MSVILNQTDFSDGMKGRKGQFSRPSEKSVKSLENLIPDSSGSLHNRAPAILSTLPVREFDHVLPFEHQEETYFFVYDSVLKFKWLTVRPQVSSSLVDIGTRGYVDEVPDVDKIILTVAEYKTYLQDCFKARFYKAKIDTIAEQKFSRWVGVDVSEIYRAPDGHDKFGRRMAVDATSCSFWYTRCFIYKKTSTGFVKQSEELIRPWWHEEDTGEVVTPVPVAEWLSDPEGSRKKFFDGKGKHQYKATVGTDKVVFFNERGQLPALVYEFADVSNFVTDLRTVYHQNEVYSVRSSSGDFSGLVKEWSIRPIRLKSFGTKVWTSFSPAMQYTEFHFNSPFVPISEVEKNISSTAREYVSPSFYKKPDGVVSDTVSFTVSGLTNTSNVKFGKVFSQNTPPLHLGRDDTSVYDTAFAGGYYSTSGGNARLRNLYTFGTEMAVTLKRINISASTYKNAVGVTNNDLTNLIMGRYVGNPFIDVASIFAIKDEARSSFADTLFYGYIPFMPLYVETIGGSGVPGGNFFDLDLIWRIGDKPATFSAFGRVVALNKLVLDNFGCSYFSLQNTQLSGFPLKKIKEVPFTHQSVTVGATKGNYFRAAAFDQGRLVLAGSKQSSNIIIGGKPVHKGRILDFDTLTIMTSPDPLKPVDAEGFRHPFTPESGLDILWMRRLREYFYVGTTLGLVKVEKLTASFLVAASINTSVVITSVPASVFNQLIFTTYKKNRIYTLEYSRDVNRETIFSVSDSLFSDFFGQDKVFDVLSSPSENFFLVTFEKNNEIVLHGQISGKEVLFSLFSFGGPTFITGVIDTIFYLNVVGKGLLECDLADFSQPIEDSAVLGLDLLSPSVLSYSDKQNVTEDRLSKYSICREASRGL